MPPPPDIDALSPAELKSLVLELLDEREEFRRTIGALRDEIARLKGGPGRPDIKANVKPQIQPSGMEKASETRPADLSGERRRRGPTRTKLTIHDERKLEADAPLGSRFKGYASFLVQDLVIRPHVVNLLRECWRTPDGKTLTAPLPAGVDGHFGPELRRFVLAQYHQGQVTAARLVTLLKGIGILISKRQVVRLLIAGKQSFVDEARAVLRAGLTHAAWITVDDTGARHKGKNGFCTQIGNAHFTYFATTGSKSRLNFLEVLRAGHDDYVVNEEALAYMRDRALAGPVVARLSEHPDRVFADRAAWNVHLHQLGVSALKVSPDPVTIATEGALWGSVRAHGFLANAVIVSDDAGQFNVGPHGLCWVHGERLVHKLDTFTEAQRAAAHPRPDLAVLPQSEGLAPPSFPGAQGCLVGPVRSHLQSQKRIRQARPLAGAPARQQKRIADGAREARYPVAHQRLRERRPLPGRKTQDQRRNPKRRRPRRPRRLPRAPEDLRQERHPLLGLSGGPPQSPRLPGHSQPRANRRRARGQAPLRAQDFRPLTATCRYARLRLVKPRARNRPRSGRDPGARLVVPG